MIPLCVLPSSKVRAFLVGKTHLTWGSCDLLHEKVRKYFPGFMTSFNVKRTREDQRDLPASAIFPNSFSLKYSITQGTIFQGSMLNWTPPVGMKIIIPASQGWNEIVYINGIKQCVAHKEHSLNVCYKDIFITARLCVRAYIFICLFCFVYLPFSKFFYSKLREYQEKNCFPIKQKNLYIKKIE